MGYGNQKGIVNKYRVAYSLPVPKMLIQDKRNYFTNEGSISHRNYKYTGSEITTKEGVEYYDSILFAYLTLIYYKSIGEKADTGYIKCPVCGAYHPV